MNRIIDLTRATSVSNDDYLAIWSYADQDTRKASVGEVMAPAIDAAATVGSGGGKIVIATPITQLKLLTTGADTFDAGSVSISYE